jgi:hypothetical protein
MLAEPYFELTTCHRIWQLVHRRAVTTAIGNILRAENTGTVRCLLVAALGGDPSLTRFAPAHFRPIPATDSDLKSATHLRNDV